MGDVQHRIVGHGDIKEKRGEEMRRGDVDPIVASKVDVSPTS